MNIWMHVSLPSSVLGIYSQSVETSLPSTGTLGWGAWCGVEKPLVSQRPPEMNASLRTAWGLLFVFRLFALPHVQLPSLPCPQQSLLLPIRDEARWLGGASARGSSIAFITSASSEWMVSKSFFLFPLGCPPLLYQSCCWPGSDMVLSKGGCLALILPRLGTQNSRRQQNL